MTIRFALASSLALGLLSFGHAQSRFSFAAVGATNLGTTSVYSGIDTQFSSTGDFVTAASNRSFSGRDSFGQSQTMTLTANSTSESQFGRLRTKATATIGNSFYNPENPIFFDGTDVNEDGVPDSFLVSGSAGFTDLLSFGQGAGAGYKASYQFFVHGTATGSGISTVLNARIGNNDTEEFSADLSQGTVAQTFTTNKYTIDSLQQQTADVSFTTRFDASTFDYAEGSTISGTADFSSTITLTAIFLYDTNDNLVTSYTVTGASGTNYPTQPVPEPATLAVLGAGAVAMLRRRRKN